MAKLPPTRVPRVVKKTATAQIAPMLTRGIRWWEEKRADVALGVMPSMFDVVRQIVNDAGGLRRQALMTWFRLYQNYESKGLSAASYFRPRFDNTPSRLRLNIIKSAVDTLHSRITSNEPRVTFLTSNGSWSDQKKAKGLDRIWNGTAYEQGWPKTARMTTKDALIFGVGGTYTHENDEGRCAIERVFIEEIIVDDLEAVYGKPRSIFRTKFYQRDELVEMFRGDPHALAVIEATGVAKVGPEFQSFAERTDLVTVVEGWHLPAGPLKKLTAEQTKKIAAARDRVKAAKDADDDAARVTAMAEIEDVLREGNAGAHMIVTEAGILRAESWRKRYFPFTFTFWDAPQRGFLNGVGIPEEIAGIQYEINRALIVFSKALPFMVPKVAIDRAAAVVQEHIDNIVMGILEYSGGAQNRPELLVWNTIPSQHFEVIERLVQMALEKVLGISQMSAQSKKPADVESAAAIRELENVESGRHYNPAKGAEEFHVEEAKLTIRVIREIAEKNGGKYPVKVPFRRKRVLQVDWSEVNLEDDAFIIQAFPVSSLPKTPAGRLDMINDMLHLGFLDKEDAVRLLALPDLDAVNELMEAAAEFVHWQIERILEHGEEQVAFPFVNLQYALAHAQAAYLSAYPMPEMPKENLNAMLRYIQSIKDVAAKALQPTGAPGEQPGVPGGPPTTPAPGEPQVGPAPGTPGAAAPPMSMGAPA